MTKNASVIVPILIFASMLLPGAASANVHASADVRADGGGGEYRGFFGLFAERREDRADMRDARKDDRSERKDETHDRRAEIRARFASSSAQMKARFSDVLQARIRTHADHIHSSLTAALDRLTAFEAKVDARLDALAAAGIDVSRSRDELEAAAAVRVRAGTAIADLDADLSAALDGQTSREEVMAIMQAAREELADVRRAYAKVLVQIRADVKASKDA